jgi:hypothetical protein
VVTGLAFVATAVGALFAEAMLVRFMRAHGAHQLAWAVALGMFTLAAAALALGSAQGFDRATFRVFFLFGAVLDVPWLALGTIHLLAPVRVARRARAAVLFFSGLAVGAMLGTRVERVHGTAIPVGKDVLDVLPRVLAAVGSGLGAVVILAGASWSVVRALRSPAPARARRLAAANTCIAAGTLVLSAGGLLQGLVGHDEAFATTLAAGILVLFGGFRLADTPGRTVRGEHAV